MPMLPGRGLRRELSRTCVPVKYLSKYSPSRELCITHIFKKVDGVKVSKTSMVLDAGPPRGVPTRLAKSKPVETGLRV
jgi:hypothetical protein